MLSLVKSGAGLSLLVAGSLCLGLLGCGANGGTPPTQRPAAANLAGNWLLAGSLPEGPFATGAEPKLSVTFSTVGDQLVATGRAEVPCPPTTVAGLLTNNDVVVIFTASGSEDSEGGFLVQSPPTTTLGTPIPSVNISGTVPASAGGAWEGSYIVNTNGTQPCSLQQGGYVNAERMQPVSGTYVATGTYLSGGTKTPVTVTMTLEQGASSTLPTGTVVDTAYVLSGSLIVIGIPCFHSGSTVSPSSPLPSGVGSVLFGAMGFPGFRMDDGSLVTVNFGVNDLGAQQLNVTGLGIGGGTCTSTAGQQVYLGNFTRQS
jgi:hypothetical protein